MDTPPASPPPEAAILPRKPWRKQHQPVISLTAPGITFTSSNSFDCKIKSLPPTILSQLRIEFRERYHCTHNFPQKRKRGRPPKLRVETESLCIIGNGAAVLISVATTEIDIRGPHTPPRSISSCRSLVSLCSRPSLIEDSSESELSEPPSSLQSSLDSSSEEEDSKEDELNSQSSGLGLTSVRKAKSSAYIQESLSPATQTVIRHKLSEPLLLPRETTAYPIRGRKIVENDSIDNVPMRMRFKMERAELCPQFRRKNLIFDEILGNLPAQPKSQFQEHMNSEEATPGWCSGRIDLSFADSSNSPLFDRLQSRSEEISKKRGAIGEMEFDVPILKKIRSAKKLTGQQKSDESCKDMSNGAKSTLHSLEEEVRRNPAQYLRDWQKPMKIDDTKIASLKKARRTMPKPPHSSRQNGVVSEALSTDGGEKTKSAQPAINDEFQISANEGTETRDSTDELFVGYPLGYVQPAKHTVSKTIPISEGQRLYSCVVDKDEGNVPSLQKVTRQLPATQTTTSYKRQCLSCLVESTPCWRPAWPNAGGILCNGCGLRYKKGGLRCVNQDCRHIPPRTEVREMRNKASEGNLSEINREKLRCLICMGAIKSREQEE